MNRLVQIVVFIGSLLLSILFAEGIAQIYVTHVAMQSKLFEPDSVAGWKLKSNLDTKRRNANGDVWTIKTDQSGIRGNSDWAASKRKVLIVGDSFAFGDGIDVENRFDVLIEKNGFSVITLGVIGYGTDQQLLMAKPYYEALNTDDIFVIMTCYNDFWDISRQSHSGRAKVWYELIDGKLQRHDPSISWSIILRDKSYLWAKISNLFEHESFDKNMIVHASHIYTKLVYDVVQDLKKKEVRILLAYFGLENIADTELRDEIENNISKLCEITDARCIALDSRMSEQKDVFLLDGHWNEKGNELVGAILMHEINSFK